jgi:D-alanyl-D-alanine dipeptidase
MTLDGTAERPIPAVDGERTLRGIEIRESGDPVVQIPEGRGLHVAPAYHARGIRSAPAEVRIRQRVLDALYRASASLPDGIDILVWDGLRSLQTQTEIVEDFRASLPEPDRDAVIEQYLALPPESERAFRECPPPHSTGGAVDLSLCDPSGRPLDLGADFDQFDEKAWLSYYESSPGRTQDGPGGEQRCRLRRVLFWAMLGAGFAPYPWEYWHYELGTPVAAAYHGRTVAEYGAAVPWLATP